MRKTIEYIVTDPNSRDFNKKYIIEEMPALKAEMWCYKAIGAMIKSGLNLPENFLDMPANSMAILGVASLLKIDDSELRPLLHELMSCVTFEVKHDLNPKYPGQLINLNRKISDNYMGESYVDIEEVSTYINLRLEVFKLHLDFLEAIKKMIMQNSIGQQQEQMQ